MGIETLKKAVLTCNDPQDFMAGMVLGTKVVYGFLEDNGLLKEDPVLSQTYQEYLDQLVRIEQEIGNKLMKDMEDNLATN